MKKPNCYDCEYRRDLAGNAHSECINLKAQVEGNKHGIKSGWFYWPLNFDPVWVEGCDGFEKKEDLTMHKCKFDDKECRYNKKENCLDEDYEVDGRCPFEEGGED